MAVFLTSAKGLIKFFFFFPCWIFMWILVFGDMNGQCVIKSTFIPISTSRHFFPFSLHPFPIFSLVLYSALFQYYYADIVLNSEFIALLWNGNGLGIYFRNSCIIFQLSFCPEIGTKTTHFSMKTHYYIVMHMKGSLLLYKCFLQSHT